MIFCDEMTAYAVNCCHLYATHDLESYDLHCDYYLSRFNFYFSLFLNKSPDNSNGQSKRIFIALKRYICCNLLRISFAHVFEKIKKDIQYFFFDYVAIFKLFVI